MMYGKKELERAADYISKKSAILPQAVITLGTGLNDLTDIIDIRQSIPFCDIPGMPIPMTTSHKGVLIMGKTNGVPVAVLQGRLHLYEGFTAQEAVFPVRLMRMLGAEKLMLTNSAGSLNPDIRPGDLMLINDHISFLVPSPLTGKNPDFLGPRFPDMSQVYDNDLQKALVSAADGLGIELKKGVYCQTSGPAFETPAEIRLCRAAGADAVGMSSAIEAAAAVHAGMKVCGVSCISNWAAGLSEKPLTLSEVTETVEKNRLTYSAFFKSAFSAVAEL